MHETHLKLKPFMETEVVTRLRAASHIMAHGNEAPVLAEWVGDA